MEGVSRLVTPPPPSSLGCVNELITLNSDSSSLTVENCGDIFCGLEDVTSHDCITWTDEKHRLYLNHLEESLVTQLNNSRGFVARCSQKNMIGQSISKELSKNASEQDSFRKRIDYVRDDMQDYPKLCNTEKCSSGKKIMSHGSATFSLQCGASKLYRDKCFDAVKEGMDQNFVNDDKHKLKTESRTKRLKLSLADI